MADIVVPCAIAVAIVGCAWAVAWAVVRVAAANARVKQDMLSRGLSVEEMERLLNPPPAIWIKPVKQGAARHSVEADIVPLLDRELSIEDIERLLKPSPGVPPFSVEADIVPLLDRDLSVAEIERLLRLRPPAMNASPPTEEAPAPTENQTGFTPTGPRNSL